MNRPHLTVCCVPECTRIVPDQFIMCNAHWRLLSYPTRRDVGAALAKARCGELSRDDLAAVRERATDEVLARRVKGGAA